MGKQISYMSLIGVHELHVCVCGLSTCVVCRVCLLFCVQDHNWAHVNFQCYTNGSGPGVCGEQE